MSLPKSIYERRLVWCMPAQQAVLYYGISQLFMCCIIVILIECFFAHDFFAPIFRLVYICPAFFVAAGITAIAAYFSKSLWSYRIAILLNEAGLLCCVIALIWVFIAKFASMRHFFPKEENYFAFYLALVIPISLVFHSIWFEMSLWFAYMDRRDEKIEQSANDVTAITGIPN